jgi:SagB-type dehydrogenase family enzyme
VAPSPRDPDYRPLLAQSPRPTATGFDLRVQTRTVSIAGPPDELLAIASLCDGRASLTDIAAAVEGVSLEDVADLIAALADAGAVVDTSEAWRVFHEWTGGDSGLGRAISDDALLAQLGRRYRQPELSSEAVTLRPLPTALDALLARRQSSDLSDPAHHPTFGELSTLLAAMYAGDGFVGRPVASGGGLYPLVIHVVVRSSVGPLGEGAWWYEPASGDLRRVEGSVGELTDALIDDGDTHARVERGQPVAIVSADVARGAEKYASRAYRLASIEVGEVTQNAYLAAADIGVPIRALLGVDDPGAKRLLALPEGTVPMLALVLGR